MVTETTLEMVIPSPSVHATKVNEVVKLKISDLINAENNYIYSVDPKEDDELLRTWNERGQLNPIIVNTKLVIKSGHRRVRTAIRAGQEFIDGIIVPESNDETLDMIYHNKYRTKTVQDKIREADYIIGLLGMKKRERQELLQEANGNPFGIIGRDKFEKAGNIVGMCGSDLRTVYDARELDEENPNLNLVGQIFNGLPINRVRQIIKKIKERPKKGEAKPLERIGSYVIHRKSSILLKEITDKIIQTCFTSPPYYHLRNYGKYKGELGSEDTPEEYIHHLMFFFKEVRRVLKDTGSLFINIADTIEEGELIGIPQLLIVALKKNGWAIVNDAIWSKPNAIPTTYDKRLQTTYEHIIHCVKKPDGFPKEKLQYDYRPLTYAHGDKVKLGPNPGGFNLDGSKSNKTTIPVIECKKFNDFLDEEKVKKLLNDHDIFQIKNGGNRKKDLFALDPTIDHPAVMPYELPVIPLITTAVEGGDNIVLDIFSGTGTVGITAHELGYNYIGYEKNMEYADLCKRDCENRNIPIQLFDYDVE